MGQGSLIKIINKEKSGNIYKSARKHTACGWLYNDDSTKHGCLRSHLTGKICNRTVSYINESTAPLWQTCG